MIRNNRNVRKNLFWREVNGVYELEEELAGLSVGIAQDYYMPKEPMFMEQELKNINVSFKRIGEDCIIFDPEVEEWTKLTAPIAKLDDRVKYISGAKHTGEVPTSKMVKAAWKYYWNISSKIELLKLAQSREEFEEYFARESEDGICCWWEEDIDWITAKELDTKYVGVHLGRTERSFDGLVLLKSAAKGKSVITIKVHEWDMGRVIGKGGQNVKRIAEALDVKTVKVKSIEGELTAINS